MARSCSRAMSPISVPYALGTCWNLLQLGFQTPQPRRRLPGVAAPYLRLLSSTPVEDAEYPTLGHAAPPTVCYRGAIAITPPPQRSARGGYAGGLPPRLGLGS